MGSASWRPTPGPKPIFCLHFLGFLPFRKMHTSQCGWAVLCEPFGKRAISYSSTNLLTGLLASALDSNMELIIPPLLKSLRNPASCSKEKVSTWLVTAWMIWSLLPTWPASFQISSPSPLSDSSHLACLGGLYRPFPGLGHFPFFSPTALLKYLLLSFQVSV